MKGLEPHSDFRRGQITAYNQIMQFIDSLPEEPISEDLEEAAEAFYDNCNIAKSSWWDEDILHKMSESKETFIAGAEWQKQKMVKDAVEGEVVYKIGNAEIAPTDVRYKVMSDRVYIPNVKLGDKVKIIIIKEN